MQFTTYSFEHWVKSVGGQVAASELMQVDQGQISRWVNSGAMVSKDGTLFLPSPANYVKNPIDTGNTSG